MMIKILINNVITIILLLSLGIIASCKEKDEFLDKKEVVESTYSDQKLDILFVMIHDLNAFVEVFQKERFAKDMLLWNSSLTDLKFGSSTSSTLASSTLRGLIRVNFTAIPKSELLRNFDSISYYLARARRDYVFNNVPIDKNIIALAKDLLEGKLNVARGSDKSAETNINTISELLRIISVLPPENLVPSNIKKSYPKLNSAEVLNLIVKGIYSQIRKSYQVIYLESVREKYLPAICARYRIIAPIMKLDPALAGEVEILKSMVPRIHELLDNPEKIYGELGVHLACVEVLEEVIGKSSNSRTGEGLTERYVKFMLKYLWDAPRNGKSCAPYGGLMGNIPVHKEDPYSMCLSNYKTVSDNLLALHIINTYLPGLQINTYEFAPKLVDVRVTRAKGKEMLKELSVKKSH